MRRGGCRSSMVGVRRLQRGHVDFQLRPHADFRLGENVGRQGLLIEVLGNDGGPGVMESFPAAWAMEGRMEMIKQRHT